MAIVSLSPFLDDLRGKLGGTVYFRRFRGRLLMCRLPVFTKPPSEKQRAQRAAFKQAMAEAKAAMQDPEKAAYYRDLASQRGISPIALAVRDYLRSRKEQAAIPPTDTPAKEIPAAEHPTAPANPPRTEKACSAMKQSGNPPEKRTVRTKKESNCAARQEPGSRIGRKTEAGSPCRLRAGSVRIRADSRRGFGCRSRLWVVAEGKGSFSSKWGNTQLVRAPARSTAAHKQGVASQRPVPLDPS